MINKYSKISTGMKLLFALPQRMKMPTALFLLTQCYSVCCGLAYGWAVCKSAPRSRQITTPAPHHSVFYRPDTLPATQPTASKHWRQVILNPVNKKSLLGHTAQHKMSPIAHLAEGRVQWELSVCLLVTTVKLLNRTRCCLDCGQVGAKGTMC